MNFKELCRVGRDAEVRTPNGKTVTGFTAAFDNGWGANKQTVWLDCSWWGDRAANLAERIKKGSLIVVSGSIGTREYEGKTYITLNVSDVQLVATQQGGSGASGSRTAARKAETTRRPAAPAAPDPADFTDDIPFVTNRSAW